MVTLLDYADLITDLPIKTSIGTIKKHKLKEIFQFSFQKFTLYELFIKITPDYYFEEIAKQSQIDWLNSFSKEKQSQITMLDLIQIDENLQTIYTDVFNFFFVENVEYNAELNCFLIADENNNVCGAIMQENIDNILSILQQICCIKENEEKNENQNYKNNLAKRIYEKMLKAERKSEKANVDLYLPNIISAVANLHPSINYTNIFDQTIFQLMDDFNRLQSIIIYIIDCIRVSVWGDEKNTFKLDSWYKNYFDERKKTQDAKQTTT